MTSITGFAVSALKRLFGVIQKVNKLADGTLEVSGFASTEDRDSQGEIITADAMKAAIPDYMKFGAVREMHQPIAAGTALDTFVDDENRTNITVHVVDPVAITKVEAGVYKAFSVGGTATKRDAVDRKKITGFSWLETSLVDVPANPNAVMLVVKAGGLEEAPAMEKTETTTAAPVAATEPTTEGAEGTTGTPVKKGLYGVKCMAELLQSVAYMAMDEQSEADYEGDKSPIPQKLRDWFSAGAGILTDMAAEEVAEMMGRLNAMAPVKLAVAKVASAGESVTALAAAQATIADLTQKAALLQTTADDVQKALDASKADVVKAQALVTAAEADAKAARDALAENEAGIQRFKDQLLEKGILRVVEKTEDVTGGKPVEKAIDPTDPNAAMLEIKKVHQGGGRTEIGRRPAPSVPAVAAQ